MVKLQKPIPKTLGNKPKLDNPIKQKKKELKKEKSTTTKKVELLGETSPVKEAKISLKPAKEALEKKQKNKKKSDAPKIAKKPLILAPQSPEQSLNGKGKKIKNVTENGVKNGTKAPKAFAKVSKKVAKIGNSEKLAKSSKQDEVPAKQPKPKSAEVPAKQPKAKSAVPKKAKKTEVKNVNLNGEENGTGTPEAPKKVIKKAAKTENSVKPTKQPSKQDQAPVKQPKTKSESTAVPQKVKKTEVPEKVTKKKQKAEKKEKQPKEVKAPVEKQVKAPLAAAPPKEKPTKKVVPQEKTKTKQAPPASGKKSAQSKTPVPAKASAPQKKAPAVPAKQQDKPKSAVPQKNDSAVTVVKLGKKGKKQKNKKKGASVPETEAKPTIEKIKKPKKPKLELQEKKKAKIAFKKAKLAAKNGEASKPEKKSETGGAFRYDPIPYDEEQFNAIVNTKNITKVAEALKITVEEEVKNKKSSIFDDYRYFLQVACFKIASCPKRMVRLDLKHSLVDKEDDVLLIVPDLQRGLRADYEPTKHHYEDLLRQNGIEGITVMPMNQLRKEYRSFEIKHRLGASYEYFMCDGRIIGHAGALLGKLTQKTRNTLHPVRLNKESAIKAEIENSLKKTAYRQLSKSSLHSIPVGTHKFTTEQLVENIEFVVEQLKKVFPGGLGNIRNLHLKIGITGTSSLPLYISMAQAPDETPMVIGPREERMLKLKREANEVLAKFSLTKEGKLLKLPQFAVEKKRKLMEMKATLLEEEPVEEPAKKVKKTAEENGKKKKAKEVKELELPEEEEEEADDNSDDEEDAIQLGQGSDDDAETEDDEMANMEEDAESGAEVLENGFVGEDDEENEDDDEQEANQSDDDENDDEEDEDDDDEEDEEGDDDDGESD